MTAFRGLCAIGCVALVLASPQAATAAQCKEVRKLTTPCTGRLMPDGLYLRLWQSYSVTVPRLKVELGAEKELRRIDSETCALRLASCEVEVREIEVIVENRIEVATPFPYVDVILVGVGVLAIGVAVGLVVGKFAL